MNASTTQSDRDVHVWGSAALSHDIRSKLGCLAQDHVGSPLVNRNLHGWESSTRIDAAIDLSDDHGVGFFHRQAR